MDFANGLTNTLIHWDGLVTSEQVLDAVIPITVTRDKIRRYTDGLGVP